MLYGDGNYILNYVEKDNKGGLLFTITDPQENMCVVDGNMDDLNKILHYAPSIDRENMDFESLQICIAKFPIVFVAKRRKLQTMDDLDFNL